MRGVLSFHSTYYYLDIYLISTAYLSKRRDATKCEVALLLIKEDSQKNLLEGRITEEQFSLIDKRIEEYLKEVRKLLMDTEQ